MNAITIQAIERDDAAAAVALLGDLRVELLGVRSRRLHAALVADGVDRIIDCRVARAADRVIGAVLAAPAGYWWRLPARHWGLALECLRARAARLRPRKRAAARQDSAEHAAPEARARLDAGGPARTWQQPGDAWRIIVIGTAPEARGRGVAAALYRAIMADRSLVARIAPDNTPSLRLHQGTGWRLHRDGDVVLGVHVRGARLHPH